MKYKYSDGYGDSIPWQSDYDTKAIKALVQNMKEDRLSFAKLLTKIRGETIQRMHSEDRYKSSPWERLSYYKGHSSYTGGLSQYWVEQLKQGDVK